MSIGGRAAARRGRVALGVAACLLLAACGSSSDSDLDERVAELQEENDALRAELDALRSTSTTVAGAPSTPPVGSSSTSSTSTSVVATTVAGPAVGTRENPRPLGEPVPAGDWTFTVVAFEPGVDAAVAELSANNDPPVEGEVYARMRLKAEYSGRGAGAPRRLTINLVAPSGPIVGEVEVCCDPERDLLTDQPEIFAGGSVEGWVYYLITAVDAFGGKFVAFDPNSDQPNVPGGIVFFQVN